MDSSYARAIPKMGQYHPPLGGLRIGDTSEFLHQVSIGQAVETVSLYPYRVETARDRQEPGHTRHSTVKRRIKTSYLRQFRITLP